jgi:hypothetical protein
MRELVSIRATIALTLLAMLAACQAAGGRAVEPVPTVNVEEDTTPEWRKIASAEDIARVERLDQAWTEALEAARKAGFRRQIEAEGDLLDPAAAQARAAPPPGSYNCRVIRFGSRESKRKAFETFDSRFCFVGVEGDQLSFTKQTGEEQPTGYLWDTEDSRRLVFLGTLVKGSEKKVQPYGEHPDRDIVGVLERYGNFRYRLVFPFPQHNGVLDVIELIPVAEQP